MRRRATKPPRQRNQQNPQKEQQQKVSFDIFLCPLRQQALPYHRLLHHLLDLLPHHPLLIARCSTFAPFVTRQTRPSRYIDMTLGDSFWSAANADSGGMLRVPESSLLFTIF